MDAFLQQKLDELKQKNLIRGFKSAGQAGFINFTSNDYLGLRHDPRVIQAGTAAAEIYGAGAGASRVAGGDYMLYAALEQKLAEFKGYEAACVFGSGYLANMGVIPAIMGKGDVIFADKLSHSCMLEAAKLSGAKLVRFKHNDMSDLERLLNTHEETPEQVRGVREGGRRLIITEEIFSMDGDFAPLDKIITLAKNYNCWTLIDGAHSLYQPPDARSHKPDIYVGTMSKALGGYGGYVCGSSVLIEYLKTKAKTLVYSTGLPPFVIGAAIKALEIIEAEKPYLKTIENILLFRRNDRVGQDMTSVRNDEVSAIVPIVIGSEEAALQAEEFLLDHKLQVSAIRPPTVPVGTSRLRISITATHTESDIDLLVDKLLAYGL